MNKRNKPRLGKGLSALIGEPVPVETETPENAEHYANNINAARAEQTAASSPVAESSKESGRSLVMVELKSITPSPYQPRGPIDPDDLKGLAKSIRHSGVMQPIVVRPASEGSGGDEPWELIAGERRWRAAGLAGLSRIPAVVADINNQTAAEWSLIENIQRQDLNPMERARALKNLRDSFGLTQSEIASQVGLERSSVANLIRLTDLPTEIQAMLEADDLSSGHGKALAGAISGGASHDSVIRLAKEASENAWSVRHLEKRISDNSSGNTRGNTPSGKSTDTDVAPKTGHAELERQLGEYLGTKVKIRTDASGKKGTLAVSFFDASHFNDLISRIGFEMRS